MNQNPIQQATEDTVFPSVLSDLSYRESMRIRGEGRNTTRGGVPELLEYKSYDDLPLFLNADIVAYKGTFIQWVESHTRGGV